MATDLIKKDLRAKILYRWSTNILMHRSLFTKIVFLNFRKSTVQYFYAKHSLLQTICTLSGGKTATSSSKLSAQLLINVYKQSYLNQSHARLNSFFDINQNLQLDENYKKDMSMHIYYRLRQYNSWYRVKKQLWHGIKAASHSPLSLHHFLYITSVYSITFKSQSRN